VKGDPTTHRLGDYVRIRTGKLDANASDPNGAYPFFTCSQEPLRISSFSYDCECVLIAGNGDLNVKYYDGQFDAYQRTYIVESIDKSQLDVRYLFHVMSMYVDKLRAMSIGGVIKYIKLGYLTEAKLPVPPLAEQRRIAEVLDRAEALRAKRRAALAQLDTLTQSIFHELFGDPATNPKGWPHKSLKQLGTVTTGGTPPSAMEGMFDGPIPFITPGDLESVTPVKRSLTEAGAKESVTVRAGATLVCCIGATIGKTGFAAVRSAFNQQINAVEWESEVHDDYGLAVVRLFKPTIIAWGASTTLPILKKSKFEQIEVPVPPLQLQVEFGRRLQVLEKVKAAHRQALTRLGELFAALQARAFRGEL
jgi:type I restriction enzyme, S subunit